MHRGSVKGVGLRQYVHMNETEAGRHFERLGGVRPLSGVIGPPYRPQHGRELPDPRTVYSFTIFTATKRSSADPSVCLKIVFEFAYSRFDIHRYQRYLKYKYTGC